MNPRPTRDDVYLFPKVPDERVAKLYFPAHGAVRTAITQEQAVYIGAKIEGTFNSEHPLLTCKAQLKVLSLTACSAVVVLHEPSAGAASFTEVLSWIHSQQVRCLLLGETTR